jgi:hypothetical protein
MNNNRFSEAHIAMNRIQTAAKFAVGKGNGKYHLA